MKSVPKLIKSENYKWYIMILGALTNAVVVAIPSMGLSVLLPEITADLHLSLVQAGFLWGISALPMIVASLFAGVLSDRFGPKRILVVSCILVGVTGALRGIAPNYAWLIVAVFVCGIFGPLVTLSNLKNAVIWFKPSELGTANGIATLGMAFGFFVGAMISATYLSPLLGGWRNVFIFYGALGVLFTIPWMLTRQAPHTVESAQASPVSFKHSMLRLAGIKELWILGLALMGVGGAIQGVLGYLPLYLENLGWSVASIGQVLSSFHISSMLFVMPLSIWSDRLGSRSKLLIAIALLTAVGIGLLSFVEGVAIWLTMVVVGSVRDSFMSIFFSRVNETRGVDSANTAMAVGFTMIFYGIGCLVFPPIGNSLASASMPGAPLIFWAVMTLAGGLCIVWIFRQERLALPARQERFEELSDIMEED